MKIRDLQGLVYIDIVGKVLDVKPTFSNPLGLSITLLCFVGVDGCTAESTGLSPGGFHTTIISPSVRHVTSPIEESSTAGRRGVIIIHNVWYHTRHKT